MLEKYISVTNTVDDDFFTFNMDAPLYLKEEIGFSSCHYNYFVIFL